MEAPLAPSCIVREIGVFGRLPRPGAGKTRLAEAVGPVRAAALAAAFLADVLELVSGAADGGACWWLAPDESHPAEALVAAAQASGLAPPGTTIRLQQGHHLGARMEHALGEMLARGPALIVGGDVPDLPPAALAGAIEWLATDAPAPRLVLGPAADGGFYLVGVTAPLAGLLRGRGEWGGADVLERTVRDARAANWDVRLVPGWRDVDTGEDLVALRERLAGAREAGAAVAPGWPARTAALLLDQGPEGAPIGG